MLVIPSGTVDHFVSVKEDRTRAYDWSNYRFASTWANSRKKLPAADCLDPFDVQDGWFEVLLPSMQLVLTDACPPEFRVRAENMLVRLGLRDHEDVVRYRRKWLDEYEGGRITLAFLADVAPLIAAAVRKRDGIGP